MMEEEKEPDNRVTALSSMSKFDPSSPACITSMVQPANAGSASARRTRGVIASRVVTAVLLLLAITFILISLLLPAYSHGVSSMTIEPIGHQYIPSTPGVGDPSTTIDSMPTGVWEKINEDVEAHAEKRSRGQGKKRAATEVADSDEQFVQPEEVGSVTWFGIEGPSIWVGPMQICSKSDWHAETICTSASRAAYHIRVLPLSLGDALLALPERPISPILLLVTLPAAILAGVIYAMPAICRMLAFCIRKLRAGGQRQSTTIHDLIRPADDTVERLAPHPTFLGLLLIGFALSIAAAAVERQAVSTAIKAWNEPVAEHVGLKIHLGALAHLMPLIPILLIAAALAAYTPAIIQFYCDLASPPPSQPGAEISTRAEISELFAETVQDSGKRLSNGSIVFSEVSPQTPGLPYSASAERMPSIRVPSDPPIVRWSRNLDYGQPSPPLPHDHERDEKDDAEANYGLAV